MNQQSMKREMVAGSIYAFGGQFVSTIAALAATSLLARLLAPRDLGIYFIAFSIVSLASLLAQFGLGRTVVRMTAESVGAAQTGRAREVIRKSFLVLAISTAAISIAMYAFGLEILATSVFGVPGMADHVGVVVLWFATLAVRSIVVEAFRGLHDLRGANLFGDVTTRCLFLVLLIASWICFKEVTIGGVIALNVAALAVTAAAGLFVLHRKALPPATASDVSMAGLVSASWPVLLTDLANGARSQADIWLLGILSDAQSVAVYGAASRLALLVPMPIIVLSTVTAPYIASLFSSGRQSQLQVMITRTTAFATILAAAAVLSYFVAGVPLVRLLYGEAYTDAYPLLVILAIGQLIAVIIGPCALMLTMTGHQKEVMLLTAGSSVVLALLGVALIRVFGPLGMALANAIAGSIAAVVGATMTARLTGVSTHTTAQSLRLAASVAGVRELLQLIRRPRAINDTQ